MSKFINVLCAAVGLFAGTAFAVNSGFYLGLDGNIDWTNFESKSTGGTSDDAAGIKFGLDGFAGYGHVWPSSNPDMNYYLAGEMFFGKAFWGDKETDVSGNKQDHSNSYELGAYVHPGVTFMDWLFYLKLGLGYSKYEFEGASIKNDDETKLGILLGVGAGYEWPLDEQSALGLRVEYVHGFYGKYDVKDTSGTKSHDVDPTHRQVKIGLSYKFSGF